MLSCSFINSQMTMLPVLSIKGKKNAVHAGRASSGCELQGIVDPQLFVRIFSRGKEKIVIKEVNASTVSPLSCHF